MHVIRNFIHYRMHENCDTTDDDDDTRNFALNEYHTPQQQQQNQQQKTARKDLAQQTIERK